jgi:hypothetical protein
MMPVRGLPWYCALVPIALAYVADCVIDTVWGRVPVEQLPSSTIRRLAIADVVVQVGFFMIGTHIVLKDADLRGTLRVIVMGTLTFVAIAWSVLRWYGAAWGDLRLALAKALGLGNAGYAFLPLAGFCLGVVLYFALRHRSR